MRSNWSKQSSIVCLAARIVGSCCESIVQETLHRARQGCGAEQVYGMEMLELARSQRQKSLLVLAQFITLAIRDSLALDYSKNLIAVRLCAGPLQLR